MPRRPPNATQLVKYTVKRKFSVIQPERCGHDRTLQRNVHKIYKQQFVCLWHKDDMLFQDIQEV